MEFERNLTMINLGEVFLMMHQTFVGTDYMFFGSNSKSVNAFLGLSFPMGKKPIAKNE